MSDPVTQDVAPAGAGPSEQLGQATLQVGTPVTVDTASQPPDRTTVDQSLSRDQWERLSGQRDVMIKAMVSIFKWLNGGVYGLVAVAWVVGIWYPDYRIVDGKTLMTLIGATVVQAGLAFVAITRFLFPSVGKDSGNIG